MIKVLIVEDQKMTREHIEDYINESDRYELTASITNAGMTEMICAGRPVDLILMDVCTDHDESGLEAAEVIKKRFPNIRIIIITSMAECSFLQRAKDAGVESFWYKNFSAEELWQVMDRTMAGESVYPDDTPEVQIGLASSKEFTKAELKVLRCLVEGMSYDEIGEELNIKPRTVRFHITNMLQKTGYANKTRLAIAVTNKKLIIPRSDYID